MDLESQHVAIAGNTVLPAILQNRANTDISSQIRLCPSIFVLLCESQGWMCRPFVLYASCSVVSLATPHVWQRKGTWLLLAPKYTSHIPIIRRAAIIFTWYPAAGSIGHLFILKGNEALISSIRVLPSGCAMWYHMPAAQLFLEPQHASHTAHSHSVTWG